MSEGSARLEALLELHRTLAALGWTDVTKGQKDVIDAFLRVATSEGYAAASMRAIGKQLNVKAPTLYNYFPEGRDQLVRATLRWHSARWATEVSAAVRATKDPRSFLDALVKHHVRGQLTTPETDMFDLLLATDRITPTLPADVRDEADTFLALYKQLFVSVIQDLSLGNAETAAAVIITLLDSVRSWSKWDGSMDTIAGVEQTATDIVWGILQSLTYTVAA